MSNPRVSHPCVFRGRFIREQVDPRIAEHWAERFGGHAPFGRLRQLWRDRHCQTLNPYESRWCPYSEGECALAFFAAADTTMANARTARAATGYFAVIAHKMALDRADQKPLARESRDAPSTSPQGSSDAGAVRVGNGARRDGDAGASATPDERDGAGLRGRLARPDHIGTVLRSLDPRSRQGRPDDG